MQNRELFDIRHIAYFTNGNTYSGSVGLYRYLIEPVDGMLRVSYWVGETCSLCSEMEQRAEFPLDEAGREAAIEWLVQRYNENRSRCMPLRAHF